jgi:hypothetical protein
MFQHQKAFQRLKPRFWLKMIVALDYMDCLDIDNLYKESLNRYVISKSLRWLPMIYQNVTYQPSYTLELEEPGLKLRHPERFSVSEQTVGCRAEKTLGDVKGSSKHFTSSVED